MKPVKIVAFFLVLLSLTAIVYIGFAAAFGLPALDERARPPLPPGMSLGCFSIIYFFVLSPIAAIPGMAGLYLWRSARKQEAEGEKEAAMLPERERLFQAHLDDLAQRMVQDGGEASTSALEILGWMRDLDEPRRQRLQKLLAEGGPGSPGSAMIQTYPTGAGSASGCGRTFGLALFLFAGICLVWVTLAIFIQLGTDAGFMLGVRLAREEVFATALGCAVPGLMALLGGFAFRWLLGKEQRRQQRMETLADAVREAALQGCLRRISSHERLVRFARADVATTLPELDGARKGALIGWLHSEGHLSRLSLGAVDLRNAVLSEADLSGADLSGADLTGAVLRGARLAGARLSRSRLGNADLREAEARKADLRQADLTRALLQRCNLRLADLREANLGGASLWQADLEGANYSGAHITSEQLRGVLRT